LIKNFSNIFLLLAILLVPASILAAAPAQATQQGAASIFVMGPDGVTKSMELKATKDSSGVKPVKGFALDADNVVSTPLNGNLRLFGDVSVQFTGAKLTPAATVDTLDIPIVDGVISFVGIAEGVYTLDVIVGDKAYECIVVIGPVAQQVIINEITEINSQSTNVVKIFEKGRSSPNPSPPPTPPPGEEPSICYFEPNNEECNPDEEGNCPDGFGHNDDNQCIPHGPCPSGYARINDDETGKCFPEDEIERCDNGAIVLVGEDCSIYDPNPPPDPAQVCFFEPSDPVCAANEDGSCNEGFHLNEPGQCVPNGNCPEGYGRLDDDETGKCYASHAIKTCPNGAKVLQSQVCPESEQFPNEQVSNDTSSEEEPEPENDPCNYHGTDVCIGEGEERQCDNQRFDCLTDCDDGTTQTTGQCPNDDEPLATEDEVEAEEEAEPEVTDSEQTVQEIEEQEEQDAEDQQEESEETESADEQQQPEQQ
jgi:hypothetical protein